MQPAANGSLCGCGSGAGWSGWLRKRRAALVWMAVVGYLLRRETEDLEKYTDQRKRLSPDIFLILFCFYIRFSLCCMKVGFTPLKGILLSAMMGFFYLLFFRQLSLDSFFCRL